MKKKTLLGVSFALATAIVVGQMAVAAGSDQQKDMGNMMNMMNGNAMSGMNKMMENPNMQKMMDAMNSPQGQEMMNACSKFMESYSQTNGTADKKN